VCPPVRIDIRRYTHGTPNGHKVTIALEELGQSYESHVIDIFAGEGQDPSFLALNPAGKIPVLRDTESDLVLTESNAILIYLADRAGKLVPKNGRERLRAIELLLLQASLVGPMFGQRSHFSLFSEQHVVYGIQRYEEQGEIIYGLTDKLLAGRDYFLESGYSIVDIAFVGWYHAANKTFPFGNHANLQNWFVMARPAVARGVNLPSALRALPPRKRA
jgi:GSH-dependent disulfide-bond oxidoreductase